MMYDGEPIFPFCETTIDSFTFNGDYGLVEHRYLYILFSFVVIQWNLDQMTVERLIDILRRRYRDLVRLDDTG